MILIKMKLISLMANHSNQSFFPLIYSCQENEDPESCRLEDSIPGVPNDDYPTYTEIPETGFKCSDKQYPGYYADVEAQCQVSIRRFSGHCLSSNLPSS